MNYSHIFAVFKAEYYTTTSKFRKYRRFIPFVFLLGVFCFSYLLRLIYNLFRQDVVVPTPSIPTFFSIIAIFSYFTLFAPLLSPLGRVVYDGSARSRREVALNSPVQAKDLMYGNLLSNMAFFLPFFGFVGTLTLAPFIGTGKISPVLTSIYLFIILSVLIIIGLIAGTLISPLIFNFISSRRNSQTRAIIAFSVSGMLIFSLPILRYFLENTTLHSNFGWIAFLPFTLAANLIVYVLYGIPIALSVLVSSVILGGYIILLLLIGYFTADHIYEVAAEMNIENSANPNSLGNRTLEKITQPFPSSISKVIQATMKASLRDIEHLSRLTIGLSITVFMIFALSSKGLFRNMVSFDERIELSVIIFALILSSASVIFIEVSSFTIQHRDMFALIKSAPKGARKFVIGKAIQMILLLTPVFLSIIIVLSLLGFFSLTSTIPLTFIIVLIIIAMTSLSLAIYLLNPSDNEEDLVNLINLLIFYVFSFLLASIPVAVVIGGFEITPLVIVGTALLVLGLSILLIYIAAEALEQMNLETLDSPISAMFRGILKTIIVFFIFWSFIPLFSLTYFERYRDPVGFIVFNYILILLPIVIYYFQKIKKSNYKLIRIDGSNWFYTLISLFIMLGIGFLISILPISINSTVNSFEILIQYIDIKIVILIVVIISTIEELFFRGFLLEYSEKGLSQSVALILNCAIFGFIHIYPLVSLINAILQSAILVTLKRRTDSVMFPIIAHVLYNVLIILILIL